MAGRPLVMPTTGRPLVVLTAGQDPALSMDHPFYDVARHGILQVAGGSQLVAPGTLTVPRPCGTGGFFPAASLQLAVATTGTERTCQGFDMPVGVRASPGAPGSQQAALVFKEQRPKLNGLLY